MFSNLTNPQKSPKFVCKICDYVTSNKKDHSKHLLTIKHFSNQNQPKSTEISPKIPNCSCMCGKKYADKSGLWRHKKICKELLQPKEEVLTNSVLSNTLISTAEVVPNEDNGQICGLVKELIVSNKELIETNKEFRQIILDQQSKIIELTKTPSTMVNSNNNTINVNMFLNEYCKNAVTISNFTNSIQPSFEQLIYMTQQGNKEGVYSIINNSLKTLKITERPFHCTDTKRQTTYIKENEGWIKEPDQKSIKRLYGNVLQKCSIKMVDEFACNPKYMKNGTREYEESIPMMREVNGGKYKNGCGYDHNQQLIVNQLCESTYIDKDIMKQSVLPGDNIVVEYSEQ